MRSKKLVLAAVMAAMVVMTGCGEKAQTATVESTEAVTVEETTEETTQEETETETEEETESDVEFTSLNQLFGNDSKETEAFGDFDEETGYLGATSDEITEGFEACDIIVEDLSQDNRIVYEDEDVLYHFVMYNEDSVQEVADDDETNFLTQLTYADEEFYVLFGSDTAVEYEEALVYCEEDTTVEYWAIGSIQGDNYCLVPIAAGNDENGYYIVRTTLVTVGIDMSDTMSLLEQGIDFKTESSEGSSTSKLELTGEEYIYLEITGKEGDEESLTVYYEMTNYYPTDVYISDAEIELNGVDITDSTVAFFEVDANDTIEDCFFIDGYDLKVGDEIVISGMLIDGESLDEIGEIEFPMVLESR